MSKHEKQNDVPPADEMPVEKPAVESVPQTPEQERDDLMARLQRLAADYQNYQKRVQKEIVQARDFANDSLMRELLSVMDDMERALEAARDNHGEGDPFFQGMQMVHDKMLSTLGKFGLTVIAAAGQPFDPEKHAAMMQQETDQAEPMTVLQEVQRGYELKGRTLRPSGVVVAKPVSDASSEDGGDV